MAIPIAIWQVLLNTGDWFNVFSRNGSSAIARVRDTHYFMTASEFDEVYAPKAERIPDHAKITATTENSPPQTKTAKEWAEGQKPDLFTSNTYEPD